MEIVLPPWCNKRCPAPLRASGKSKAAACKTKWRWDMKIHFCVIPEKYFIKQSRGVGQVGMPGATVNKCTTNSRIVREDQSRGSGGPSFMTLG